MQRCALLLFLAAILAAQSAPEVEITAEPHHHLAFANDQVRVFTVDVPAHSETLLHWHRHDYIFITLGDSEVVNAVQGKDPVTLKLQDGQAGFLPGPFVHIFRNLSPQPFRNVTIELLRDAKLRQSRVHWDSAHPEDDRGLEILHGGTKEILFVKDGVRVSEFEVQTRGMAPVSLGPYLLVAVSDLELLQTEHNAPIKAIAHILLKPGEVQWLPANHRSTLTNMGRTAKFVTLEFH
jgi:hypothetical protein